MARITGQRQVTEDYTLERMQDYSDKNLEALYKQCPLLDGRLITGRDLTASASQISHGLGRTPLGYFITKRSANQQVWNTAIDENFLTLQAGGNVTVDIWVF